MTLVLRDVVEDDLPIFFEHQREPEGVARADFKSRDRTQFFAHWRANVLGDPKARVQTIEVDTVPVGNVSSWSEDGRRLVGYWFGHAHWGRGYATAALGEYLTKHELTRPLFAYVAPHNAASVRVLEKQGFVRVPGEAELFRLD